MKKVLKILTIILWVILFAGAGVLLGFVDFEQSNSTCRKLDITVNYGQSDTLVRASDLDSLIRQTNGNIEGKRFYAVNTERIEKPVRRQPYVEDAHVYMTQEGTVYVDVQQRQPILRIITKNYSSFYIDGKGQVLPLNPNSPARVLIASGNISDSVILNAPRNFDALMADSSCVPGSLASLFKLAIFIVNDPFFKSQIEQIYLNEEGEIELIPTVGDHMILIGSADDLEEKFHKLFVFYKLGMNQFGWNKYNRINIKFKNQVVCSKI